LTRTREIKLCSNPTRHSANLGGKVSDPAGAWARPLKPQTPITDSELLTKQVITGINYDPSLAIPDQGSALDAGIKLYPVIVEGSVKPSSQPMREALTDPG
jgi:hypothetical protein